MDKLLFLKYKKKLGWLVMEIDIEYNYVVKISLFK